MRAVQINELTGPEPALGLVWWEHALPWTTPPAHCSGSTAAAPPAEVVLEP